MADDPLEPGLPPARPDQPYVVQASAARPAGRSALPLVALGAVVAVVVGLSAWGLLDAPAPRPSPPAVAVASGAAPTRQPGGRPPIVARVTVPLPADDGEGLPSVDLATRDEAFVALAVHGGWRVCPMWQGFGEGTTLTPQAVATAIATDDEPGGMYLVPDTDGRMARAWVGGTADDAARGFGGSAVVRVRDGRPTVDGPGLPGGSRISDGFWTATTDGLGWKALRLGPLELPSLGLTAWQIRDVATPAPYCVVDSFGGPAADVIEVPPSANPVARLSRAMGWDVCREWLRMELGSQPTPVALDEAVGDEEAAGWYDVRVDSMSGSWTVPVWVGDEPPVAGARHGSMLVVLRGPAEPRQAWIATSLGDRPLAVAFDVVRTRTGTRAWLPTASAAGVTGDCDLSGIEPGGGDGTGDPGASPGDDGPGATDPVQDTVEILRGGRNRDMLTERLGWAGCRMLMLDAYRALPDGAAIDRAAITEGVERGPLTVDPGAGDAGIVWLGEDVVTLARWQQAPVVAADGTGVAWLADETAARAWAVLLTPAGRVAWAPTGSAMAADGCELRSARASLADVGARSVTCWTDRDRCLESIAATRRIAPDAFGPAFDVAAGLGDDCPPLERCPWDGPTQLVFVTSRPAAWRAPDEVRAFQTGARRFSRPASELERPSITPGIRGHASLPSLGLHVREAVGGAPDACPPFGIDGRLDGRPWDPALARIDRNVVQWPAGFRARFVPELELLAPDGRIFRAGDRVQASGTAGIETGFVACAVSLVESERPLPSAP